MCGLVRLTDTAEAYSQSELQTISICRLRRNARGWKCPPFPCPSRILESWFRAGWTVSFEFTCVWSVERVDSITALMTVKHCISDEMKLSMQLLFRLLQWSSGYRRIVWIRTQLSGSFYSARSRSDELWATGHVRWERSVLYVSRMHETLGNTSPPSPPHLCFCIAYGLSSNACFVCSGDDRRTSSKQWRNTSWTQMFCVKYNCCSAEDVVSNQKCF